MWTKKDDESSTTEGAKESQHVSLLKDLASDPYFQYVVRTEADNQTRAQLLVWWKIISGAVLVIAGIMSYIGYHQYSDLSQKKAELETSIKAMNESAKKASDSVGEIDQKRRDADTNVTNAKNLVEASQELVSNSKQDVEQIMDRLFSRYEHFQELFERENRSVLEDNKKATAEGRDTLATARTEIDKMESERKAIETARDDALTQIGKLKGSVDKVNRLEALEAGLARAKTFSFVMIESHRTETFEIEDPMNEKTPIVIQFIPGHIEDPFGMEIRVAGHSGSQFVKGLHQGSKERITALAEKGFAFEVVALRHRFLSHPFAVLKVYVPQVTAPTVASNAITSQ
jgi:hypothetical protein